MLKLIVFLSVVGFMQMPAIAQTTANGSESAQVIQEACGSDPQSNCMAELAKICHAPLTFRCYYSRKGRLDAIRQVGFPDDRPRGYDE